MTDTAKMTLNQDDRLLCALAHAAAAIPLAVVLLPLVLWIIKRRKSAAVSFHALQAMAFQVLEFVLGVMISLLSYTGWMVFLLVYAVFSSKSRQSSSAVIFGSELLMFFFVLAPFILWAVIGLVGAVLCLTGQDFRYPWLGSRMARYLQYAPVDGDAAGSLPQEPEDRMVSALGHTALMVPYFGWVMPLILWLTGKDDSRLLRFQAAQAAVYQLGGIAAYILAYALFMVFTLFFMLLIAIFQSSAGAGVMGIVLSLGMLLFFLVFLLIWPIYTTLPFVAAYRLLKGRDYQYPLLGKWLARWFPEPAQAVVVPAS